MKDGAATALGPLYLLTAGTAVAAAGAHLAAVTGPALAAGALAVLGLAGVVVAARAGTVRAATVLWLAAGVALGAGRGLAVRRQRLETRAGLARFHDAAVRFQARIREGWTAGRWGWRTRIRLESATHAGTALHLPRGLDLEVRGATVREVLPAPGARCTGLASLRGDPGRLFLAVASSRLLHVNGAPRGLDALRDRGATALLQAAGTDPVRIRAAELAAALVFGRRDLIPAGRRDRWRLSGMAHVLAISGLHVGILAGMVWLLAIALGASPNLARALVLAVVPTYAMLAGASPSAVRAAIMVAVYVGARMLGRPLVPMAAVLLAATVMLLVDPVLIASASFQLTVGITAALVRWVPELTNLLPLPQWLGAAIAVPVIAQLAAAPMVAWHFRTLIPGAVLSNLLVPFLLAPLLVLAFAAAVMAPVAGAVSGLFLSAVSGLAGTVLWCGGPARAHLEIVPALPALAVAALAGLGLLALWPGRRARAAALAWVFLVLVTPPAWRLLPEPRLPGPLLLPVRDGLAAVLPAPRGPVLVDGGRLPGEAVRLLADLGIRRLSAVIASHTDEDHCGGLPQAIATLHPARLIYPAWMGSDPAVVPLLRRARRAGTVPFAVARGVRTTAGGDALAILWPPFGYPPARENDRCLVARVSVPGGTVLLTSDISARIERRLLSTGAALRVDVLVAAHHGSATASTIPFLRAAAPACVLVPAGPWNIHHHPSPAVLRRLRGERLPWRAPIFSGLCGARRAGRRWRCWP